ncbi:MAG: discoidin domain-containing protein [Minicystis sp.]
MIPTNAHRHRSARGRLAALLALGAALAAPPLGCAAPESEGDTAGEESISEAREALDTSNLALGKPTSQSSVAVDGVPARAVDGNTDGNWGASSVTHTNTEAQPWWKVDLGSVQPIGQVILHNRTDCCADRLSNFKVSVSDDGAAWQDYPYAGTAPTHLPFDVNRSARYVKVQLNGTNALSLAEVQVFRPGAQNLALGRTASQSSVAFDGAPSRAVDGNTDGNWGASSVTHTNTEAQPWWKVDLGSVQPIGTVMLFNRTDCCADRLGNFKVSVSDDGNAWQDVTFPGTAPARMAFSFNRTGRYVKVQLNGTNALSLAEVQVFGPGVVPNLATGGVATQSSLYGPEGVAAKAIDGNTDGNWGGGSITHTSNEWQPWWKVDLGGVQQIGQIILNNRTDCCSDRLGNFRLSVSDDGNTWQDYPYAGTAPTQLAFDVRRTGRFVKVQLNGFNPLSLAEVQVLPLTIDANACAPRGLMGTSGNCVAPGSSASGYWQSSGGPSATSPQNVAIMADVAAAGPVTFELNAPGIDGTLYLLDGNGTVIASNDSGDIGGTDRITASLAAGTYKLVAATRAAGKAGSFNLTSDKAKLRYPQRLDVVAVQRFQWVYDDVGAGHQNLRPDLQRVQPPHQRLAAGRERVSRVLRARRRRHALSGRQAFGDHPGEGRGRSPGPARRLRLGLGRHEHGRHP